jgi:hypothetical protein
MGYDFSVFFSFESGFIVKKSDRLRGWEVRLRPASVTGPNRLENQKIYILA